MCVYMCECVHICVHLHRNSQKAAVTTLCTLWGDRNTVHTSTTLALF
jgi:hypothetical protein